MYQILKYLISRKGYRKKIGNETHFLFSAEGKDFFLLSRNKKNIETHQRKKAKKMKWYRYISKSQVFAVHRFLV